MKSFSSDRLLAAVVRLCAVSAGVVLFVAGFLKLMDPTGATLVMHEYFKFLHLGWMSAAAGFVAVLMALTESIVGAALIAGVWRRPVGIAALALMGGFTLLTLILVIANPVMDCGCFGEAVHLSHAQTFLKNIILLALLSVAFFVRPDVDDNRPVRFLGFGFTVLMVLSLCVYSIRYLPLVDFTDYAVGACLLDESDPRAHDGFEEDPVLSVTDQYGFDESAMILSGDAVVCSVYGEAGGKTLERVSELVLNAQMAGIPAYVLAPADIVLPLELGDFRYVCDRKTLMTLNRSNGGAVLLRDGVIVCKWASASLPSAGRLEELCLADASETVFYSQYVGRLVAEGVLLLSLASLILI